MVAMPELKTVLEKVMPISETPKKIETPKSVAPTVTQPTKSPSTIPSQPAESKSSRGNRRVETPKSVEPTVSEPVSTQPTKPVEVYYNIDNPQEQYSHPVGQYGKSFQTIPNPIKNPQNVMANTNLGVGYGSGGETKPVEVYYNIDNPSEQFSRNKGRYNEVLKPVNPKSYSITLPSTNPKYESETTTYTYNIDPTSVVPNVNQRTENPRYDYRDVRFEGKKQYIPNTYVNTIFGRKQGYVYVKEEGTINPRTYFNIKVGDALSKLEPVSQIVLDTLFFNPQTKKVNTSSPAYRILSAKVSPDYSGAALGLFISPYLATGTQTYQSIFGNQNVVSSSKQVYLSPMDVLDIPRTTAKLAGTEYKLLGKEVAKVGEDTIVKQIAFKQVPQGESLTTSVSRLTPTGADRLAVFTKGITYTDIESSSGFVFRTTQPFTFIGKVTNILPVGETTMLQGTGQGFYYPYGSNNPIQTTPTKLLSQTSNTGKYTNVAELQPDNLFWYDLLGKGRVYGLDFEATNPSGNIFRGVSKPRPPSDLGNVPESFGGTGALTKATNTFEKVTNLGAEQLSGFAGTGQSASTSFSVLSSTQGNVPNTLLQANSPALILQTRTTQNELLSTIQQGDFKLDTKSSFKIKQIPDVISPSRQESAQKSSSGFREAQVSAVLQTPRQESTSRSFSFKRTISSFNVTPETSRSWFRPTKDLPRPNVFSKPSLFSKVKKAFNVVTFRKGKEEIIAKGLPEGLAKKAGVATVLSTLRASFKLKPVGETTIEDIDYKLPRGFGISKVDKGRYVQLRNTRFGARAETKEAQFFRKQKARSIKWF